MKKIRPLFILVSVCLVSFTACKKDKKEEPEFFLSAKVDGAAKTTYIPPNAMFMVSQNNVQIHGEFSATTTISISIINPQTGTFNVGSDDNVYILYHNRPNSAPSLGYLSISGKVQ